MRNILSYSSSIFQNLNFEYKGNVQISLSGGRSSAAMLRLVLDHHGGKLPDNYRVVFSNTGLEHAKTYDFLARIEQEWQVRVHWIELGDMQGQTLFVREVNYERASRKGEPFRIMLRAKKPFPPRKSLRICTTYLKVKLTEQFLIDNLGWDKKWTLFLGYRSDEKQRLHNAKLRCVKLNDSKSFPCAPLIDAGIEKNGVIEFFAQNSFDLNLASHLGNCVFCFMKGRKNLQQAAISMPSELNYMIKMEEENSVEYSILYPGGYRELRDEVINGLNSTETEDFLFLECNCTD